MHPLFFHSSSSPLFAFAVPLGLLCLFVCSSSSRSPSPPRVRHVCVCPFHRPCSNRISNSAFAARHHCGGGTGSGQYAQVFKAVKRDDGNYETAYAVKCIDRKDTGADFQSVTDKEIQIMKAIDHKNCVKLFEIYQTDEQVCSPQPTSVLSHILHSSLCLSDTTRLAFSSSGFVSAYHAAPCHPLPPHERTQCPCNHCEQGHTALQTSSRPCVAQAAAAGALAMLPNSAVTGLCCHLLTHSLLTPCR